MIRFLLIRHGQTDWNRAQRFQGQSDVPLNEVGRQQAMALANRLSDKVIDVIYSSDLQRALETARGIAQQHTCDVQVEANLREINFGDWEGLTYDEIKKKQPQSLAAWENDIYKNAPPNGETLEQLTMRVQAVLEDLRAKRTDKTVLLVAHGGVLQTLICLALNLPATMYWHFHLSPASLSEIAFYPAGAILNSLNDTRHLSGLPKEKV